MASAAKTEWETSARARLDELEAIQDELEASHTGVHDIARTGTWGVQQLSRNLFVVLVAQFQAYCRSLHEEAVDAYVAVANPNQEVVLRQLLTHRRQLDRMNPRPGALEDDFGRLGIDLLRNVQAARSSVPEAVDSLEALVTFRNAVVHGSEDELSTITATGRIEATLTSFRAHRDIVDGLVGTMDGVVSAELAAQLGVRAPW